MKCEPSTINWRLKEVYKQNNTKINKQLDEIAHIQKHKKKDKITFYDLSDYQQENEHDYAIKVETKDSMELCCPNIKYGSTNFVKNGTKKNQYFWDIPIHGKRVCLILDRQKYKCKF